MTAVTPYGIELEVAIAIGTAIGRGRWDEGNWDEERWDISDEPFGDWVDVTCDTLDGVSLRAGSDDNDGLVTRWEAATCSLTFVGDKFDPWHGPWAPSLIGPNVPLRVRWRTIGGTWAHAFLGAIDDQGYNYEPAPPGGHAMTEVIAVDRTSQLATWDGIVQPLIGEGETASARIVRILDMAEWPPEYRDVTAGGVAIQASNLEDEAWGMMLDVADADLGLLWISRDGKASYRPQGRVGESRPVHPQRLAACPEGPDDIQLITLGRGQPTALRNHVSVSRGKRDAEGTDPPVTTLEDVGSVARYQARRYSRTDLMHANDAWSLTLAQVLLGSSAWPSNAPHVIALSTALDVRAANVLLSLEPDQTFDVLDDKGGQWRQGVLGWDVEVTYGGISGTLTVDDITRWVGNVWDGQLGWDRARFGVGTL